MKPPRKSGDDNDGRASKDEPVITLLITMADTTWRIFTPVVVCAGLGIWGDVSWHTKPMLTLAGATVGFVVASFLIADQIKRVRK